MTSMLPSTAVCVWMMTYGRFTVEPSRGANSAVSTVARDDDP